MSFFSSTKRLEAALSREDLGTPELLRFGTIAVKLRNSSLTSLAATHPANTENTLQQFAGMVIQGLAQFEEAEIPLFYIASNRKCGEATLNLISELIPEISFFLGEPIARHENTTGETLEFIMAIFRDIVDRVAIPACRHSAISQETLRVTRERLVTLVGAIDGSWKEYLKA